MRRTPRKKTGKASKLRARVERALEDRQWGGIDLGDILDKAREDEVDTLKPFVPAILAHHDWKVRIDALAYGLDRDIPRMLAKWKRSARKGG